MTILGKLPAAGAGVLVAILATGLLQPHIENDRVGGQREALEAYVAERAAGRNTLFEEAQIVQQTAADQFRQHYADLDQETVDAIF